MIRDTVQPSVTLCDHFQYWHARFHMALWSELSKLLLASICLVQKQHHIQ